MHPHEFRKSHMFYTGVTLDTIPANPPARPLPQVVQIQRTGVATSLDLFNWTHEPSWIYSTRNVSWAYHDTSSTTGYSPAWQFRDPFVFPAPDTVGHFLMLYVTVDSALSVAAGKNIFVVGAARSHGDLRQWSDIGPLLKANATYTSMAGAIESPHAFLHHGKWWLQFTSVSIPGRGTDVVNFEVNPTSPVNPDSSTWSNPRALYLAVCGTHDSLTSIYKWHASEYLGISQHEYLAAFSDRTQSIELTEVEQPTDVDCATSDSLSLMCPTVSTGVSGPIIASGVTAVRLALRGASPSHAQVGLRLELPTELRVNVALFDVAGRRVKTIASGMMPAGRTDFSWRGESADGKVVGSGVYFARLTWIGGQQVVRVVLAK